jgi:hypothetical protein
MPTFDEYTTQHGAELSAALTAFEQQETPKGFINSHENGMALIKHLADNNMPATLASLELSARMHVEKGYKFYLTPQELALQNTRNNFTAAQLAAFDAWWGWQKHLVHTPQAETAILAQLVGRIFTNENFDSAAGRASYNGLIEEQRSVHYQQGQYSGRTDLKDETPLDQRLDVFGKPVAKTTSFRGSIREQYEAAIAAREARDHSPQANAQAEAQRECENMRGNTHGRTSEIQKCFVTKNGQIDWVETRNARRQIQDMPGDGRGSGRSV